MDTRDQTQTKLTRFHGKYHPTHHRPASLRWNYSRTAVSIMKLVMEDGWWWRQRRIALSGASNGLQISPPGEIRAWRRLRIVKCDEIFSLIFLSVKRNIWSWSWGRWSSRGPTRQGARPRGRACPLPSWTECGPLTLILSPIFFINSEKLLHGFSGHSENFYFYTKITPLQFCWKLH